MTEPRLEARLARWGALAGGLAHEIKNPLSTMNISLQLLREDLQGRAQVAASQVLPRIDLVISEIERLQGILNDFLRLVREPELTASSRDPNDLVEEIVRFVQPELAEHGIDVVTQLDRSVTTLQIDSDLFRQAFLNLVKNAQHAMADGGVLTIQTRRHDDAFAFDVIDTGSGIAEGIRDRIFDGFFSTKSGGTGIGLSLTRQIIELHGGEVSFQTAHGRGTMFTMLLPMHGAEPR